MGGRQAPAPVAFLSPGTAASYQVPALELQASQQFSAPRLCPQSPGPAVTQGQQGQGWPDPPPKGAVETGDVPSGPVCAQGS